MSVIPIRTEATGMSPCPSPRQRPQQRHKLGSRPRAHPYQRPGHVSGSGIQVSARGRTFSGKDGFPEPKPATAAPGPKKATPTPVARIPTEQQHTQSKKIVIPDADLPSRSSFVTLYTTERDKSPEIRSGSLPAQIQPELETTLNPVALAKPGPELAGQEIAVAATERGRESCSYGTETELEYETAFEEPPPSSFGQGSRQSSSSTHALADSVSEPQLVSVSTSTIDLGKRKSKTQIQNTEAKPLGLNLEHRSSSLQFEPPGKEITSADSKQKKEKAEIEKKGSKHSDIKLSGSGSKSFDFGEYFGITDEKEKPYGFESYPFNLMHLNLSGQRGLRVRSWIAFFPCTTSATNGCFKGKLAIRNTSHVNMAYMVKCSKSDVLQVWEPKGYLTPKQSKEIVVTTKPQGSYNFQQFRTAAFLVLGIPVYFRKQLKPEKIDLLWKAYEKGIIREHNVESHEVGRIEPGDQSMMADFSVLSMLGFGILSRWPGSHFSTRLPLNQFGGGGAGRLSSSSLSVDAFHSAWNCVSSHKLALLSEFENCQLRRQISKAAEREEKEKRARWRHSWRSAAIYALMLLATVFAGRKWLIFTQMQSLEDFIGCFVTRLVNQWIGESDSDMR